MSEIRLFNINKEKIDKKEKYDNFKAKEIITNNLTTLLKITPIGTNFSIGSKTDNTELIGYDESYQLVIVEFKREKNGSVVKKGFKQIDYIKANVSRFKTLIRDLVTKEAFEAINYCARLIVIGEDFTDFDCYAINQTSYEVDLIKMVIYKDFIVLEKTYQGIREQIVNKENISNPLFNELNDFILSLGDEVCVKSTKENPRFLIYRRITNLCYCAINDNELVLTIIGAKLTSIKITKSTDLDKAYKAINNAYDEK